MTIKIIYALLILLMSLAGCSCDKVSRQPTAKLRSGPEDNLLLSPNNSTSDPLPADEFEKWVASLPEGVKWEDEWMRLEAKHAEEVAFLNWVDRVKEIIWSNPISPDDLDRELEIAWNNYEKMAVFTSELFKADKLYNRNVDREYYCQLVARVQYLESKRYPEGVPEQKGE
jgi:hypothetical protein